MMTEYQNRKHENLEIIKMHILEPRSSIQLKTLIIGAKECFLTSTPKIFVYPKALEDTYFGI